MQRFGIRLLLALGALSAALPASAQTFPSRPVRIVVGFPAGGGSDIVYRKFADKVQGRLGQLVIIENRAGAGGVIAAQTVVSSPADGYTLYGAGTSMTTFRIYTKNLPFDVQKDLAPISLVAESVYAFITNPNVPAKNLKEFVAYAKANPGKLNYGSPGGAVRLGLEWMRNVSGIDMVHVQYKGAADYATALMADQVQLIIDGPGTHQANAAAGKVRILAVASAKRYPQMPDIPTAIESGLPGFIAGTSYALFAPAATPRDIITRLNRDTVATIHNEEFRKDMLGWSRGSYEPTASTPEELAKIVDTESRRWQDVARFANIQPE